MEEKKVTSSSSSAKIDPNETISSQLIIKDAIDKLYYLAHSGSRKEAVLEPKWHKCLRYMIGVFYLILIFKTAFFLLLYLTLTDHEIIQNERIFVYLGDYAYQIPAIRIHWNIFLIQPFLMSFHLYFMHIREDHVGSNWIKLLDCMAGFVKPMDIHLSHERDVKRILKR
jgi:hypothetical protein